MLESLGGLRHVQAWGFGYRTEDLGFGFRAYPETPKSLIRGSFKGSFRGFIAFRV